MKTALVCAVQAPFIVGGAEILVQELRDNLHRRGFKVDVANVPFKWYPVSELVRQALAWRLLDVTESNGTPVDLVIPTKFPSYLVRHPRKVAWLFHQHREAYDLYGTEYCSFRKTPEDDQVREAIQTMDEAALSECRTIFTISRNVSDRLRRYNGLASEAPVPAAAPPRPLPQRGLRRLPLLCRPPRPPEAPRPRDRRHEAGARRGAAQDRGRGAAAGGAAQADRGPGGRGPGGAPGLRLRRRAGGPLRPLSGRLLRAPQRGLRLRHRGGVSFARSPWSPPPTPAGRSSS